MSLRRLSSPITDKKSVFGQNSHVKFAGSSIQGWRPYQEDEFVVQLDYGNQLETSVFAAVFDGHGGPEVSRFCAQNFAEFLRSTEEFQSGDVNGALRSVFPRFDGQLRSETVLESLKQLGNYDLNVRLAEETRRKVEIDRLQKLLINYENKILWKAERKIVQDQHKIDMAKIANLLKSLEVLEENCCKNGKFYAELVRISAAIEDLTGSPHVPLRLSHCKSELKLPGVVSGSTACVLVIRDGQIHVGNVGDSRCVMKRGSEVISLTTDHKPVSIDESSRITAAGGKICEQGRINGDLNISRTLGDFRYKENLQLSFEQQIVISQPDVISLPIKSDVEFLVLASDGVWEVMNNQEVCEFISSRLKNGMELVEICEELVEFCSKRDEVEPGKLRWTVEYNFGTFDNVTVVIVALK